MSRVIFVNRFYWPDEPATGQLLTDLAEQLARAGLKITVVTSRPPNPASPRREWRQGVRIIRVRGSRMPNTGWPGRLLDFLTFTAGATWCLLRQVRRDDRVVFLTDPPLLATLAWPLVVWRRAALYHWIQDIYPEIAVAVSGRRWLNSLRPLRNAAWRRALACVTLDRDMAGLVAACGVLPAKIHVLSNWAPAGLTPAAPEAIARLRADWGLRGKFVVAYSGNLGRVHLLQPILEAAAALRDEPGIAFIFIGRGAQLAALQREARRQSLTNVEFLPPQPRAELALTLSLADLHLVTMRPGCAALVSPSKIYGIAAVARPMFFLGPPDCDPARQIAEAGMGRVFGASESIALAGAIRQISRQPDILLAMGRAAAGFARTHTLEQSASAWLTILNPSPALAATI